MPERSCVNDNSSLTLQSPDAIDNSGTIELELDRPRHLPLYRPAALPELTAADITLSNNVDNVIAVTHSGDQLTNFDNTISGAGTIGNGGMVLVNDATINADDLNALTLDPTSLTNTHVGGHRRRHVVLSDTTVSNVPYSFSTLTDPAAPSNTGASGINDADQIVGTYISSGKSSGFLYDGGNYITLDDPAATGGTSANAINNAGEVVGTYTDATGAHGFLFSNGSYSTLNDPSATNGTFAEGINDAGQVVGYYDASGSSHGFLRSGGTYITLDDPLGTFGTSANDINDAGEVVGTYTDATGAHGFLYNNGTYTTLNDPLAAGGTYAEGINGAGQVVGYYGTRPTLRIASSTATERTSTSTTCRPVRARAMAPLRLPLTMPARLLVTPSAAASTSPVFSPHQRNPPLRARSLPIAAPRSISLAAISSAAI